MQIFTGTQIKDWDVYTIEHEPIRSIDLMERAADAITGSITRRWDRTHVFVVLAGPGNNGGDALAVARMLAGDGYDVKAFLFNIGGKLSDGCAMNAKRLKDCIAKDKFQEVTASFEPPHLDQMTVVVDGLFGSGLHSPLSGGFASLVKYVNASEATVVSIDLPSGLMTEDNTSNIRQNIIRADVTLTLQQRKLAMYLADNAPYLGEIETLDIGLSEEYVRRTHSSCWMTEEKEILDLIKPRPTFAHKGIMGHAMLFAGSYGMAGAAILATKAAFRTGAGKVTLHTPLCNNDILQVAVPEAVLHHDGDDTAFTEMADTNDYDAVAMGPGLGQREETAIALMSQIRRTGCPMVLDADALNILSNHRAWLSQLPRDLVMTPHPAEFDRIVGTTSNGCYDRLAKAREWSEKLGAYIILKGHYSALCCPDGETIINPTGNAGMATAGSGDVLTGIITGLLARGYSRRAAAVLGMYIHGLAGDLAAQDLGEESLMAGDIIDYLPKAFRKLTPHPKQD